MYLCSFRFYVTFRELYRNFDDKIGAFESNSVSVNLEAFSLEGHRSFPVHLHTLAFHGSDVGPFPNEQ